MKSRLMRGVAVLPIVFAGPALAASPTYDWSGFYLGLNAGGDWTRSSETTSLPCTEIIHNTAVCDSTDPGNAPLVSALGTGSFSGSHFSGGIGGGYNWQNGPVVYGVEFDAESLPGTSKSATGVASPYAEFTGGPISLSSSVDPSWLVTARGRIGYAFNDLLVYGTGGLAVTRLSTNVTYSDGGFDTGTWTQSENKAGWAAGGGVEWALSKEWSVKAEYLFVKFGSVTASGAIVTPAYGYSNAISTSADLTVQIARAGINYKF
ncbi:MAG: outer membrane protein [Xanthobacteraceae bacterium]